MKIDETTVRKIARLARIKVDDTQIKTLEGELTGILDWVDQLNEVDTEGVEPMTCVTEMSMHMRDDEVTDGQKPDEIIANAPASDDHFFMVPKVVE